MSVAEISGQYKWQKRLGMIVVIAWLLMHVFYAQYLVDLVKAEKEQSGYLVVMQYVVQTLQFLAGGLVWDLLKRLNDSEIDWSSVVRAIKEIAKFMFFMMVFFIAAISTLKAVLLLSISFALAYLWCGWKLATSYVSFVSQIRKGVGKL